MNDRIVAELRALTDRVAALEKAAGLKPPSHNHTVAQPRCNCIGVCRHCSGAIEKHEIGVWVHKESGRTLCKVSD